MKILSIGSKEILSGIGISPYYEGAGIWNVAEGIDFWRYPGLLATGYAATSIGGATVDHWPKWIIPYGSYVYVIASKLTTGDIYRLTYSDDAFANGSTPTFPASVSNLIYGATYFKNTIVYVNGSDLGEISNLSNDNPTVNNTKDSMAGQNTGMITYPIHVGPDNKAYIGDGNDVDSWDGTTFTQAVLALPVGSEVIALGSTINYLVIGTSKMATHTVGYSRVYFWDTWSALPNRVWNISESPIRKIIQKGAWTYVFVGSSLYRCSYDNPPEIVFDKSITNLNCNPDFVSKSVSLWKGMLLWGDSDTKRMWTYGSPNIKLPTILNNPFIAGTGETIYGIEAITNSKIYVGAGTASTYKLYALKTGNASATVTTSLIDLGRPYHITGLKVVMQTAGSITASVQNAAGTAILSDTIAVSQLIQKQGTINPITDQVKISLSIATGARIKRIDLFGEPTTEYL